jgi:cytochrome c-type biogenesis protein CcsB
MAILESIALLISTGSTALALIFTIIAFAQRRNIGSGNKIELNKTMKQIRNQPGDVKSNVAAVFAIVTIVTLTLAIVFRGIEAGRGPFSNMYEFAIAFAWGVVLAGIIFRLRYKTAAVQTIGLIVALILLIFAVAQYTRPAPLVPALQQSVLLSLHVICAVISYGTLSIGFGAAILVLIQNRKHSSSLPESEILDTISYHSVVVGFPFLTLLIVLGALWADIAWGRYWSWDPKESASLVTWLIYAGYIHARTMRGWRQNRAAILLIIGFAAILLTFFGNYIFGGLHSYR